MIQTTDSNTNQDSLDALIDRTLSSDAEQTRSRFAVLPNAQLTSKLALATASRGILGSIASKIALYAGAVLITGGAWYLIPKLTEHPRSTVIPPVPSITHPVSKPDDQDIPDIGTKSIASPQSPKITTKSITPNVDPSPKTNMLQIDESDGKNIPTITDPKYQSPLK